MAREKEGLSRVRRRFRGLTSILVLVAFPAAAALRAAPVQTVEAPAGTPAPLAARSAILIDQATGRVLFQKNPDEALVPASLAKLMSLHVILQMLEDRSISRTDVVSLSANAWAEHQAPGSTLMNLGPGQIVTVEELMKGMAVASGNDAATALAEYAAGSTAEFVRRMNDEARFLGYGSMRFTDPAGVKPDNRVTAREFAQFCRRYVEVHPGALAELHSLREFTYPLAQNVPGGLLPPLSTKKQFNANYLVWDQIGVDGLKTGHLDDANFTAAFTARRGDTRLIVVLLGVPGTSLADGARRRAEDGLALLVWGFHNFSTVALEAPPLPAVRVWKGSARDVAIGPATMVRVTARLQEMSSLKYTLLLRTPLQAPILKGQNVGELVYSSAAGEVARIPLEALAGVEEAGLLGRAWDGAALGLSSLARDALSVLRAVLDSLRPAAIVSAGNQGPAERRTP
jgi:D-alanyl-D-alanine carboxypeptidase (penicillin-binding protein 5/6)